MSQFHPHFLFSPLSPINFILHIIFKLPYHDAHLTATQDLVDRLKQKGHMFMSSLNCTAGTYTLKRKKEEKKLKQFNYSKVELKKSLYLTNFSHLF